GAGITCMSRLLRRLLGRGLDRRWCGRVGISEDDRQAILRITDDNNLRIRGLRELQGGLDASPSHIRIGNALTHDLFEIPDSLFFDLLSLGFLSFAFDAKLIFLNDVVLFNFAVDCAYDARRKLNPEDKCVDEIEKRIERNIVRVSILALI